MKAIESQLLKVLKSASQFDIPIYQRTYSWTESECRQLWEDILRAGSDDSIGVHFMGSIVYIETEQSQVTQQPPLHVIDGQQRLTAVTLLLAALAEAVGDGEPIEGFSGRKIRNYYLVNPEETGDKHYKLLLTQTDRSSLIAIVDQAQPPMEKSVRVSQSYALFKRLLKRQGQALDVVCKGIAKLFVVDLALTRGQDNPQLIFESMNSTGLALSQADLIRNFILMDLPGQQQRQLYRNYWRPIELDFGQEAYGKYFDAFMRDFLTVKTGEIPKKDAVYEAFKAWSHTDAVQQEGIDQMLHDLREYSSYYRAISLGSETDHDLRDAFADLRDLKVEVANPFLLELYADYRAGLLTVEELVGVVRLVESYVFRRAVCAIPTNSLNKTFATFTKSIDKRQYAASVEATFMTLPSYRRFPRNEEFRRDLKQRDMYNFRRGNYWLRRLENAGRKERVPVDDYTIEHIMPQNPELSPQWQADLGQDWRSQQETWLNTLGNLTLTGYNSEYSDRPFAQKRDMTGGFAQSPLRLNQSLGQVTTWNEAAIEERAATLAKDAEQVWPVPAYEPKPVGTTDQQSTTATTTYTLGDHPQLAQGPALELFQALRTEVVALDPCVTETVLKLYIAFKAETNFVDVVPQASRLRLSLNLTFPEINDPRGICKDTTNLGRWGNGDVEVMFESASDLPYIMGLVRQSLDRQLTDESA